MGNNLVKEEKKTGNNSLFIAFLVCLGIIVLTMICAKVFRDFDAQGYVNAVLNQHYQGEIEGISEFIDGKTEDELIAQYEEGVISFVQNNITSGVEIDEELEQKYIELGKEIFMIMQYNVKEAEKINSSEYRVPVEYQTMNVFSKFIELVEEASNDIKDKVEKGEYQGTLEEINAQMQKDFLENAYLCLLHAYREVRYEFKETMIFKVSKNDEGLFVIDENQIHEFTTKIMGLDEIQDYIFIEECDILNELVLE